MKFENVSHARDITFKKLLSRFSIGRDFLANNKKLRKEKNKGERTLFKASKRQARYSLNETDNEDGIHHNTVANDTAT